MMYHKTMLAMSSTKNVIICVKHILARADQRSIQLQEPYRFFMFERGSRNGNGTVQHGTVTVTLENRNFHCMCFFDMFCLAENFILNFINYN
jgi:hypothetical protein